MKYTALLTAFVTVFGTSSISQQDMMPQIVASDLLAYTQLEILSPASISLQNENGDQYLELEVFPFQPKVNGGIRAEISVDFPHPADATVTYSWRFRLPENSQSDRKNRWWIVAQWHDQPDIDIGETWETKPATSPAISLTYGVIDGVDHFGFSYGAPDPADLFVIPFPRGQWLDMKMVIDWSQGPDGSASFYLDNMENPVAKANGRNMYNAYRNYFKLGIYRHPGIQVNAQVHIDDVLITVN